MLRFLFLTAVVAAALCMATAVRANPGPRHLQAESQQLHRFYHASGYLLAIGRVAHRTIYSSNPTIRGRWKRAAHWLASIRRDAARKLYVLRHPNAPPVYPGLPPHAAGWLCVHSREGAWNDEGAPYYGGLQMSYGWEGVVTDAAQLTPAQQMWAAEKVAAQHGFSYSWMQGQWPETFPPCASYFSAG